MASPAKQPKSLEIRVREIVFGDRAATWRATVFCPGQSRSLDLTDCLRCREFVEMSLDPGEHSGVLKCHPGDTPTASGSPRRGFEYWPEGSAERSLATLADTTPISTLVCNKVRCVSKNVSVEALAALLIENRLGGVPVVDEVGKPVGVVSHTDLVRHHYANLAAPPEAPSTVGDIMTSVPFTLNESASVSHAAALMALERIERIPVVDATGQVVGLLSPLDVLYWLACETGYVVDVVRSFLSKQ